MKTLTLTRKQLSVWNHCHYKFAGISYNENANEARGRPNPEARLFLRNLHSSLFGICDPSAPLTWKDVQNALKGASA